MVLLSSPNKKFILSGSFLNFLRIIASLRSSSFEFGKILPHPREFDHHFCPGAGELGKKNCPGGRNPLLKNISPGVAWEDVPSWN